MSSESHATSLRAIRLHHHTTATAPPKRPSVESGKANQTVMKALPKGAELNLPLRTTRPRSRTRAIR